MKSIIGRLATIGAVAFAASLCGTSVARASDIDCKSAAQGSSVHCEDPHGEGMRCSVDTNAPPSRGRQAHRICESATLAARYERIYAEQQRMLHKGTMLDADVTAWRAKRDACDSVRCLESLFARFWRERDAMRNAPRHQVSPPPAATAMPDSVRHEPVPMTPPIPQAQEAPTSTQPPATHATPEPTELTRPSAPPMATPAVTQAPASPLAKDMNDTPDQPKPAALALESLVSGLAILGVGAGFLWTRRTARAQDRPCAAVPVAMVIAYGLLLLNVLLLPFTLGLK
uniref:Lipoprotein n=2 Tax=Cupriavidus TaxID=106589 RepID=Q46PV9_CUPPJ